MSKPEYTNLFTVSANPFAGDVILNFYNEWVDSTIPPTANNNVAINANLLTSLVLTKSNAEELARLLIQAMHPQPNTDKE